MVTGTPGAILFPFGVRVMTGLLGERGGYGKGNIRPVGIPPPCIFGTYPNGMGTHSIVTISSVT